MSATNTLPDTPADKGGPAQPLLIVRNLQKYFPVRGGILGGTRAMVQAVDGVSFEVKKGETLGIVGESGCGKSTTARLMIGLIDKDKGEIIYDGQDLGGTLSLRDLRRGVQMVFQDSYASLNPRLTIEESIAFGARIQGLSDPVGRARSLMERVGLAPDRFAQRYPHEVSGGQRQRINIARALAMSPRLVVLDEAVSALDKSVEAQVLNLLDDLRQEFGLTYIFISHDLNVVRYISDRILVMYLGEVVEVAPVDAIWARQAHPYTRSLFSAMPSMDPDNRTKEPPLAGDPPNPINPPKGCRFHTRCRFAHPVCKVKVPTLGPVLNSPGHLAACHLHDTSSGHPKAGLGAQA
ncbi:ABC transporter ATP-binding protein [Puniceibacterium sp. IMCC21224]|uniref:ABC transporter ATP-binding protein n=1 Tax=Puniceibacterium sp. IMCC21224 TaxID=1618204 RepID=UPI00064E12E7|nr:oligopeptide/dipeptide ABC transporter ATP-binding protein [Puniceibacterium sp. IMCC21224]KMK68462.1 oligopeptide/dipeptide ABC transporter, ATP-binding protein [Puniceibacterium sp. IMCC21224]